MSTSPQPPRPPNPPQPPGRGAPIVTILLLVVALIVLACGIAVWMGVHVISHAVHVQVQEAGNGKKEVSIKTPIGSLEVHRDVNEASLGLPIYPGASRRNDDNSATVNLNFGDKARVRILAGKFETPDALEKVRAFYHDRLGDQVTRYKEKDEEGKTVFELKHDKQTRVVALKTAGDKTTIELVRVTEGQTEGN